MIFEEFYIEDWYIKVIIVKNKCDIEKVIEVLHKFGCTYSQAIEAYENINKENIGFTFALNKQSLIYIGQHKNKSELINTIAHESRHLQQYISLDKHLNENSEEVCYLLGKIVQILYEICIEYNLI